jgi:hypothetical protein
VSGACEIGGDEITGRHGQPDISQSPDIPPPFMCALSQARLDAKTLRHSFGELRSLPYYCSTAGEHSYRRVNVYEVRNVAPNRRDHGNRRPVAALGD